MFENEILGETRPEYIEYMRTWARQYLGRVRSTVLTVAALRSEIDELAEMLDGIRAVRYDRPTAKAPADDEGMLRRIERFDTLKSKIQDELDKNLQWQADAHRALRNVRQPWRAVLTYRYLGGMTWAEIAERTGYSVYYCKSDLHSDGLVELFPYIPHEYDELPGAI